MQLGLFGVVESDAHGQQLPAPRAQGPDAAGRQPAASPSCLRAFVPPCLASSSTDQPHHSMEARCADEREINDRDQAQADEIFEALSGDHRLAFEMWLRQQRASNYRGTLRLALLRQWMRSQGLSVSPSCLRASVPSCLAPPEVFA